jgi:hypothetical protein
MRGFLNLYRMYRRRGLSARHALARAFRVWNRGY